MADSKPATPPNAGSSKLRLPTTTTKRGSSLLEAASPVSPGSSVRGRVSDSRSDHSLAQPAGGQATRPADSAPAQREILLSDEPTAISKQPPISAQQYNAASAAKLVGEHLMHFRIDSFVGGGGMGAVFRGHDETLGRTVAVKVLSQDSIDEDTVRRFRHEAQSAAKLDHPGIPRVYYVGEDRGWHFIVFEFIEGENTREYVAQHGPLSIAQSVVFVADLVDALQHASRRRVVHRDIKPSNVLITPAGEAKLVDMGLARTAHFQSGSYELTATGVTLGTFDYISPEQARDPRSADIRSDIYSLGCTLYFMLTGSPPFPEGTMLQKLLSHTTDAPPDPSEIRDDVPDRLTELLGRMLAKNPDHRFQDAGELQGEILFLAEEEGITLNRNRHAKVVIERPVVGETGWRRHIPWVVPLIVLVGTAIGLQAWQVPPADPPDLNISAPPLQQPLDSPSVDDDSAPMPPDPEPEDV